MLLRKFSDRRKIYLTLLLQLFMVVIPILNTNKLLMDDCAHFASDNFIAVVETSLQNRLAASKACARANCVLFNVQKCVLLSLLRDPGSRPFDHLAKRFQSRAKYDTLVSTTVGLKY